jgi:hypothetical protein
VNLQAYADHRKALGLRGKSHVAVIRAINSGRLYPPAVQKVNGGWVIDATLADAQWAGNTDPNDRGQGFSSPPATAHQPLASGDAPAPRAAGAPSLAMSKQVKAAYEAKLAELEYKEKSGNLVQADDVKKAASRLARVLRDLLLGIPNRNAARLAAMADPDEVRALLQSEIEGALRSLPSG